MHGKVALDTGGRSMNCSLDWRLACTLALLAACARQAPEPEARPERPQQAKPHDPGTPAERMLAIRGAVLSGDQEAARRQMEAMNHDLQRAIRLPDPARRIPQELARARVKAVQGVSTAAWMNNRDLVVLVTGAEYRDFAMSERICHALEPLGDTLWVTLHLQDRSARTGGDLAVYSRTCQLQPGERALMQDTRQVDPVDPALREQQRMLQSQAQGPQARAAQQADDHANAEALRNIPEM